MEFAEEDEEIALYISAVEGGLVFVGSGEGGGHL